MAEIKSFKGKCSFNAQTFCSLDGLLSVIEMFNERLPNSFPFRQNRCVEVELIEKVSTVAKQ